LYAHPLALIQRPWLTIPQNYMHHVIIIFGGWAVSHH
jgi:hypothetical protein